MYAGLRPRWWPARATTPQFIPARLAPSITEKVPLMGADGYFASSTRPSMSASTTCFANQRPEDLYALPTV